MRIKNYTWYLFIATILLPLSSFAQEINSNSGFISDVNNDFKESREKIISLAEAIPQDKYTWRPADSVRSVSEVLMHIAGSNYFLMSFAGIKVPENSSEDVGKNVIQKDAIIDKLKNSFDDLSKNLQTLNTTDLDKQVKMFGKNTSVRNVIFTEMGHLHEHLGQLIAYARMNGIVPPWSK